MSQSNVLLAIIIPAYKHDFFKLTLESIAFQTNQRFHVYIGDDASPNSLADIVRTCPIPPEKVTYRRFETNLGKDSLVRHWQRCIDLSIEPWIWLFSDDDIMEPECVERFYNSLDFTHSFFDLYRFNTKVINYNGNIIAINPPHPEKEIWSTFAYHLLRGARLSNQQEIIFRREAFDNLGGFHDFPLAWCSDHAFAISCGTRTGIYTIPESYIRFRQSGLNFSSKRSRMTDALKRDATLLYVLWMLQHVQHNDCGVFPGKTILRSLIKERLFYGLRVNHRWIPFGDFLKLASFMNQQFSVPFTHSILRLIYYNIRSLLHFARIFFSA